MATSILAARAARANSPTRPTLRTAAPVLPHLAQMDLQQLARAGEPTIDRMVMQAKLCISGQQLLDAYRLADRRLLASDRQSIESYREYLLRMLAFADTAVERFDQIEAELQAHHQ